MVGRNATHIRRRTENERKNVDSACRPRRPWDATISSLRKSCHKSLELSNCLLTLLPGLLSEVICGLFQCRRSRVMALAKFLTWRKMDKGALSVRKIRLPLWKQENNACETGLSICIKQNCCERNCANVITSRA